MPCSCSKPDAARVNLVDGTVACTWCPAWKHECEARHVLNLPTLAHRQAYLYGMPNEFGRMAGGIQQRRGDVAMKQLQATMLALWSQRKANEKADRLGRATPANDKGNEDGNERKAA
jgi:hypothetical protein